MIYCIYCGETSVAELVGAGFFLLKPVPKIAGGSGSTQKKITNIKNTLNLANSQQNPFHIINSRLNESNSTCRAYCV